MLCDKVACDWPKTCHLGHLAMFYWLLNLTWIATSFDECGLASLVFNLTGMPRHLTHGISLGLKDMHMIGGLPVHKTFFDEVIPLAKELSQTDQQGKPFFPKTCAYLFSAFYRLSNDSEAFPVNDPSSIMPLTELAEQLDLQGISTDTLNDIFDGVTSPSFLDTSSPPVTEALINNIEVVAAQAKSPKVHEPSLCLSSFVAPNFEPQETISPFKKSYILQMCGALHEWLTRFSVESSNDF
ncbi:hypothetical protein BC332_11610 [Capsicum chinense]|nr:hypothetical protein BC332_11610 [Capsicum chinense]